MQTENTSDSQNFLHKDFLRKNDLELQALIDGIDHGIALINASFRVRYLNQMMSSLFQRENSSLPSRNCYQVLYNFQEPCSFCPFKKDNRLLPPSEGSFHVQQDITIYEDKELGEKKVFFHNLHTIVDYKNRLYIIEVLKDITQDKRQSEERLRYQKLAALGTVIQSVAHELQNPLTGINFMLQKMLVSEEDLEKKSNLLMMQKDLQRASFIVTDLHNVHRHETYFLEPLVLQKSIRTAYQDSIRNRGIAHKMYYNWECEETVTIMGNERQLHQVFVNLFVNALDAFSELGVQEKDRAALWVVVRKETDSSFKKNKSVLKVQIIDNGGGISEQTLARIFDPYFTTKKENNLSMGLGLHLVNRIMEEHAGKIEADSNGILTRFSLLFPFEDVQTNTKRYSGHLYERLKEI